MSMMKKEDNTQGQMDNICRDGNYKIQKTIIENT